MYYGNRDRAPKPVNVGEELNVTIEAVGEKGDGVAKKDGFVLFVPGVKQGQRVRIRVTKVLQKVGFAEVIGEATAEEKSSEGSSEEPVEGSSEEPAAEPVEENLEDSEDFGEEEQ